MRAELEEIWSNFQDPSSLRFGARISYAIQYAVEYSRDLPRKLRWPCAFSNFL